MFEEQFGAGREELGRRQFYLVDTGGPAIGTGTAWFKDDFGREIRPLTALSPSEAERESNWKRYGRVHWLAIVPEYQGRGLGKALLSAVCGRLKELGHERAYLTMESVRVNAIGLYLGFGFEPLLRSEEERRVWEGVLRKVEAGRKHNR